MGMHNADIQTKGKVIYCLHCNNHTYVDLIARYHKDWNIDEECMCGSNEWNIYLCPVCDEVTLEHISECSEDLQYDHNGESYVVPKISILYPVDLSNSLPDPHKNLPEELFADYEEARSIAHLSPRGSAALLRLILQKLCEKLGAEGRTIDANIKDLVSKGLPENLQKAFDVIRILGNNAVHPGTIDLKDDIQTVEKLFIVINMIIEHMICQPNLLQNLYANLPPDKIAAIQKRDNH